MADNLQVAAFEGGEIRRLDSANKSRETVLALPLNRLLVKIVRVPAENVTDIAAFCQPILQEMSPFPDSPLTVSCEIVRETDHGVYVLAAALPEEGADDIAEALDAAKLSVTRVDALALGALRGLWSRVEQRDQRRLVLIQGVDGLALFVLEGDMPCAIRSVVRASDLKREIFLSLLDAEDFGGAHQLSKCLLVGDGDFRAEMRPILESFAPVDETEIGPDAALVGVADRTREAGTLNAIPASWREVLEETRGKSKLIAWSTVAGGVWVLVMAVLLGVPFVFGFMTSHQKALAKEHRRDYEEVVALRKKAQLVEKYADRTRGSLEVLKAISDRAPEGLTLSSWNYNREKGVSFKGEAEDENLIDRFKLALRQAQVFPELNLGSLRYNQKSGLTAFDLDCRFEVSEVAE